MREVWCRLIKYINFCQYGCLKARACPTRPRCAGASTCSQCVGVCAIYRHFSLACRPGQAGFEFFLLSGNIQARWHHAVDRAAFWALVKPDHPWETPLCKDRARILMGVRTDARTKQYHSLANMRYITLEMFGYIVYSSYSVTPYN